MKDWQIKLLACIAMVIIVWAVGCQLRDLSHYYDGHPVTPRASWREER
jgi:hypothetical protein